MEYPQPKISEKDFIHEENDFVVINKPAGISTHPLLKEEQGTLIQQLIRIRPSIRSVDPSSDRPGVVHRLDRDTSGLIVVAKTKEASIHLVKQFSQREVEKIYTALVWQPLSHDKGIIETLIGRDPANPKRQKVYPLLDPTAKRRNLRKALTTYRALKNFQKWSLIEALPKTGRRHQIRVHLASTGHPLAGDRLYGFKNMLTPKGLTRHFLHASYLKFAAPDGTIKEFRSELPEELQKVLDNLE